MPNYEIKDDEVKIKQGYTPLPLRTQPITITIAKLGNNLIVDPSIEEEQVMEAKFQAKKLTPKAISVQLEGRIRIFHATTNIRSCKIAQQKAADLRKTLTW